MDKRPPLLGAGVGLVSLVLGAGAYGQEAPNVELPVRDGQNETFETPGQNAYNVYHDITNHPEMFLGYSVKEASPNNLAFRVTFPDGDPNIFYRFLKENIDYLAFGNVRDPNHKSWRYCDVLSPEVFERVKLASESNIYNRDRGEDPTIDLDRTPLTIVNLSLIVMANAWHSYVSGDIPGAVDYLIVSYGISGDLAGEDSYFGIKDSYFSYERCNDLLEEMVDTLEPDSRDKLLTALEKHDRDDPLRVVPAVRRSSDAHYSWLDDPNVPIERKANYLDIVHGEEGRVDEYRELLMGDFDEEGNLVKSSKESVYSRLGRAEVERGMDLMNRKVSEEDYRKAVESFSFVPPFLKLTFLSRERSRQLGREFNDIIEMLREDI